MSDMNENRDYEQELQNQETTETAQTAQTAQTTQTASPEKRFENNPYGASGSTTAYSGTPHNLKKKKKERKFMKRTFVAMATGISFGLFAGLGIYIVTMITGNSTGFGLFTSKYALESQVESLQNTINSLALNQDNTATLETVKTNSATTVVTDVTNVVKNVMPSVVSVSTKYVESGYDFFGQQISQEAESAGSGIIVGKNETELLVVTNYHVIADSDEISVQFIDDTSIDALVKGSDSDMDLAVLAIKLADIPQETLDQISIATIGDSESLQVGEPAIAIGNALGYGQSVTTGVISAVDRPIDMDGSTNEFIQTDAAINPGNSGGALLNISGEVIGINSNKIVESTIEGMGYAIPISSALPIIENLMSKETLEKVADNEAGYLGITGVNVTTEWAEMYSMPEGVYITRIYEGSPAEQFGLKKGDVIISFDGTEISSMEELIELMAYYSEGTSVDVKVMRLNQMDYAEETVTVVLGSKAEVSQ